MEHLASYTTEILGAVAITAVVTFFLQVQRSRSKLPPGPWIHPLHGHSKQIAKAGGLIPFFRQSQKIYGNVFTVWMGGSYRVVISGYATFHKVLIDKIKFTSKRTNTGLPSWRIKICEDRPGISRHVEWKDAKLARQRATTYLNNEGMGKTVIEPFVIEEADKFCEFYIEPRLQQREGLDTIYPLIMAVENVLFNIMIGERYEYDDPKAMMHIDLILEEHKRNITYNLSIPFTKWIPGDPFGAASSEKKYQGTYRKILSKFDELVADRRGKLQDGCSPDLMVDHMLLQYKPEDGDMARFDRNIGTTIQQMYAGGSAPGSYLCWAMLYLAVYPEMQEKFHNEIDNVIGVDEVPQYNMRGRLPYADAFVLETFRHSECVHFYLPRTTEIDLEINGKMIPAGTELMFNIDSVYNDPQIFENASEFDPERFFKGDIAKKKACVETAFGLGRRSCIAIPLGKMQVFLILVRILQKYSLSYEGDTKPLLINMGGINSKPSPHRIVFTQRKM